MRKHALHLLTLLAALMLSASALAEPLVLSGDGAIPVSATPGGEAAFALLPGVSVDGEAAEGLCRVTLSGTSDQGALVGYVSAEYAAGTQAPALPEAVAVADAPLSSPGGDLDAGAVARGETVTLLGRDATRWLISRDGAAAAVDLTALRVPEEVAQALGEVLPQGLCQNGDALSSARTLLEGAEAEALSQYGPYTDLWPLALQQYRGALLEATGEQTTATSVAPEAGDLAVEDAAEAAYTWFAAESDDVMPMVEYTIGREFLLRQEEPQRVWRISFHMREHLDVSFSATVDAATGRIVACTDPADYASAMQHAETADSASLRLTQSEESSGTAFPFWSLEDKHAYALAQGYEETVLAHYALPQAGDISPDSAQELAWQALRTRFGLSDTTLSSLRAGISYSSPQAFDPPDANGNYQVDFYLHSGQGESTDDYTWFASVNIDASTGEVTADSSGRTSGQAGRFVLGKRLHMGSSS